MKRVDCRISTVELLEGEMLNIKILENERFRVNDFYELKRAALKLGGGNSFFNLIEIGAATSWTRKAYKASCSLNGSYYKKAEAFVAQSFQQWLAVSLMIKLNKPVAPTRVFRSRTAAINWINQMETVKMKLDLAEN